jgi:hypothetical protein
VLFEFGGAETVADGILAQLPNYMGLPFEALCRDSVRLASAAGALPARVGQVGTWWNPDHQLDVVGLDDSGHVAGFGECKWHNRPFGADELERYLDHTRALGPRVRPDVLHLLFSKSGFDLRVLRWAETAHARLLGPADLLAPFGT